MKKNVSIQVKFIFEDVETENSPEEISNKAIELIDIFVDEYDFKFGHIKPSRTISVNVEYVQDS